MEAVITSEKQGFKKTKLGWIPEDWEVSRLFDIGIFYKGKGISKKELSPVGLPCVRYGEIYTRHDFTIREFYSFICREIARQSQKIYCNDILFAGSGETAEEIGKAVAYLNDHEAYAGGDIIILRVSNDNDAEFLAYLLNSHLINHQKSRLGEGQSVVHIYINELSQILIPYPPLPEQNAIAKLLSIWDKALDKLTRLIELKEKKKKWLMQQLLTGKKRLKGFTEEWKSEPLHLHATEVSIRNKESIDLTVLSCTKYDGLVPSLEYFGRKVFADDLSTYKVVPKSHFAYATNHIEEGSIGYQIRLKEALISPMYTVFKTFKSINDDFLYLVLKSHVYIHEYKKRMEGSINRRGGLRWEEFSKIKIPMLPMVEQIAIAEFFNVCNLESELLTRKADQIKEQKKGLMQVLLTGKKRLKVKQ